MLTLPVSDAPREHVRFLSEGIEVAGDLWVPAGLGSSEQRPAIVVGHGFGVLKESLVAAGEYFSNAGYVTLSIDYRTFGESAGEPRGQLFPLWQVEDFRNAISSTCRRARTSTLTPSGSGAQVSAVPWSSGRPRSTGA